MTSRLQSANPKFRYESSENKQIHCSQCSVAEAALRARAAPFRTTAFRRIAAVLVQPDAELFRRQSQQASQEGKMVPQHTVLQMRGALLSHPLLTYRHDGLFSALVRSHLHAQLTDQRQKSSFLNSRIAILHVSFSPQHSSHHLSRLYSIYVSKHRASFQHRQAGERDWFCGQCCDVIAQNKKGQYAK